MDPYKGVIRWSAHRTREHFAGILSTVILIPAIAAVVAAFIGLPPKPTAVDQIENALIGLGVGIMTVAAIATLYAIMRAPYEQRKVLRDQLSARSSMVQELESSVLETVDLTGMAIARGAPSLSRPEEYTHLQFSLTFTNAGNVAVKYSLQEISIELPGILPLESTSTDSYRIPAAGNAKYIVYANFDPVQYGRAAGIMNYRVWYGPVSNPNMYEQNRRIQFANTPDINQTSSSTSFIFLPGNSDELRAISMD